MTVGALSAPAEARTSPTASGCPCQSISSHSPPEARMKSQTHSPARTTSAACAGSALSDGMRRNSASSSNHGSVTARDYWNLVRRSPNQEALTLWRDPGWGSEVRRHLSSELAEVSMARAKPWEVSDLLWERIAPLLPVRRRRFRYPGRKPV